MSKDSVPELVLPTLDAKTSPVGLGGLMAGVRERQVALPLRRVTVRARLIEHIARTTVTQEFENNLDVPVEAVHIFPLPEDGAVVAMTLTAGDVSVTAECREREKAEAIFDEARLEGFEAALLTAETADVHTLRVSNLPPKTSVVVQIELIETLPSQDGEQTWRFPTVIAPRYLPGEPIGHGGPGVYPDTDRVPDASRLQPPLRLEGGTELDLEVTIEGRIRSLRSSLHAVRADLGAEDGNGVKVAPAAKATLDRDFVLAYALQRPEDGMLRAWTDGAYTLLGIEPPVDLERRTLPRDAVLVIDISGSMAGQKLAAAKVALKTVLHGLQAVDSFRLIAFNNRLFALSEGLLGYDQTSLDLADAWVDGLEADGGTEMLPAVQAALAGEPQAGSVRTVVFITDGEVWNTDELVAAVYHRRGEALFFTLGIDTAVHGSLLKRLAKAGGGACKLVTPGEDLRTAVAGLESRIGLPLAEGLRVTTGEPADPDLPVLFAGQSASILLKGSPRAVTVKAGTASGEIKEQVHPLRIAIDLAPLWARARITALEARWAAYPSEREGLRGEIIALALKYGIASRFTAFVAVQRRVKADGTPVELVQPVELPVAWSEDFHQMVAAAGVMTLGSPARGPMRGPIFDQLKSLEMRPLGLDGERTLGAFIPEAEEDRASPAEPAELEMVLLNQGADGSWSGDVQRTAAGLVFLVLSGHTRLSGDHRGAARKAYAWLKAQGGRLAEDVLSLVEAAEAGGEAGDLAARFDSLLDDLVQAGEEGRALKVFMDSLG